jgi:hypothetical protein
MNVLYHMVHWLQLWTQLQSLEDESAMMKDAYKFLKRMVMHVFTNFGWSFQNRIEFS